MNTSTTLTCQNEQRRYAVRAAQNLNGLDYLEVSDDQYTLTVYFLGKAPKDIFKENVRIEGGRRIRNLRVVAIAVYRQDEPDLDDYMEVVVDRPGDFSTYTLSVVELDENDKPTDKPLHGFDPRYAHLNFSFKVSCPSDLDCKSLAAICPPEERAEPEINYLAKDYASFRQLILDRLALILPDWKERHIPDLGITLVEILAYVGDYLSYYQDAVATEAYLDTARQRISVRRHTRLVDYQMHEGCNARALVCLQIGVNSNSDINDSLEPKDIYFITRYDNAPTSKVLTKDDLQGIANSQYEVFEPVVENLAEPIQLLDRDFINVNSLIIKLKEASDPLSQYLREHFSHRTQGLLDRYDRHSTPSEELQQAVMAELKRQIERGSLYDEQRFALITLTDGTRRLLEKNPQGKDLMQLNRWLLEEAYPQEIAKSKIYLRKAHNEIAFYTWGDRECCLPRGATTATLKDDWAEANQSGQQNQKQESCEPQEPPKEPTRSRKLNLAVGDILIFEEILGAKTGNPADADITRRHAVRLTKVTPSVDELLDQPIVEIEWAAADALPFPFCISAIGPAPECKLLENISVARGNVILVDHGRTIATEPLGSVSIKETQARCKGEGRAEETMLVPSPFRPHLKEMPLTFSQPILPDSPASSLLGQDPRQALPQVKELIGRRYALNGSLDAIATQWTSQYDLLNSTGDDLHFVVEIDNDGRAYLRFGDGELGKVPEAEMSFEATYRVGNGLVGNVGAEAISYIVFRRNAVFGTGLEPRNPLPAGGGISPELLSEVKLFAPSAFRKQLQRAITADDYARLAERHPKVQKAAATLRWMGSWSEVLVAIDPLGTEDADEELLQEIAGYLHRYRRVGHDVTVVPAQYVSLDIELIVCLLPSYLRGHVKAALLQVFSDRILPDGRRGFFYPDNLTFGDGIALSKLVAVAQAVPGVESVTVKKLERLYQGPNHEIENGILPIGSLEIARVANDPNFPENGQFRLDMRGGR
jgi:hypothetical protein